MQVVTEDCNCNTGYHCSYGIYYFNASTGLKPCSHVKWVTMTESYNLFVKYANLAGYSSPTFTIGVSALGRAQGIAEEILQELYKSNAELPAGQYHTVSVLGYGATLFVDNYPYYDGVDRYRTQTSDLGCSK